MPIAPDSPILVVISDGQYLCFSLTSEPTTRDAELVRILMEDLGGVSDKNPDGHYHFNVEIVEGNTAYCTLNPVT